MKASTLVRCTHHWILGSPKGGLVHGTCVNCGAERDYEADFDDILARLSFMSVNCEGKEVAMSEERPRRKRIRRRKEWFDSNKEAILADLADLGDRGTCRKWNLDRRTLSNLQRRWHPAPGLPLAHLTGLPPSPLQLDQEQLRLCADGILSSLIEKKLITGNYFLVGLCIVEALSQLIQPPPKDDTGGEK